MSQLEFLTYSRGRATYRVPAARGRVFVTFYKTDDLEDAELAQREELASAMIAIKTTKRARPAANYERGRAKLEAAGAKPLELDDREPPASARKWLVRIYYRSAGDELLCFDAGPFFLQTAEKVRAEHKAVQVFVPDERPAATQKRKPRKLEDMYRDASGVPSAEMFDRDEVGADAAAQGRTRQPNHGARLVVLPSQRYRPVETVDAEPVLESA